MSTFIRFPEIDQVKFQTRPEEEDYPPDFDDPEMNRSIQEKVQSGNEWAWCTIVVSAVWNGFVGEARLGGCSYESEENFLEDYAQHDWMMCDAYNDLLGALEKTAKSLEPLMTRESVNEWLVSQVQEM
jgi:hypothetical protein